MRAIASQIISLTIVYSTVYSGANQSKHQSSASLAFVGEFTGTGEFPAQRASYAENVSIWWRHHGTTLQAQFDFLDKFLHIELVIITTLDLWILICISASDWWAESPWSAINLNAASRALAADKVSECIQWGEIWDTMQM